MKIFKYIFLSLAVLTVSCKNDAQQAEEATDIETVATTDTFPDMSIFNLPSNWTTQDGEEIELKDLQGKVVAMVMIYTSCQAACPRLVADMRNIERQIPEDKKGNVQYVFVSIDPITDTPERLADFAKENQMEDDKWLFLRVTE